MTKEQKRKEFAPKPYALYENNELIEIFDSHAKAKAVKYKLQKEAYENMLDLTYKMEPYV